MSESLRTSTETRKDRKRQISKVVYTRAYRPPEVILVDHNYNQSADIWSLGCVLAELLACTSDYHKVKQYDIKKRVLFKGSSCYPISPLHKLKEEQKKNYDSLIDKDD